MSNYYLYNTTISKLHRSIQENFNYFVFCIFLSNYVACVCAYKITVINIDFIESIDDLHRVYCIHNGIILLNLENSSSCMAM